LPCRSAALNARNNPLQQIVGNVSIMPDYVAANVDQPTAAGYHLGASCTLDALGLPHPDVELDFDGEPRDATLPTIGPDECP